MIDTSTIASSNDNPLDESLGPRRQEHRGKLNSGKNKQEENVIVSETASSKSETRTSPSKATKSIFNSSLASSNVTKSLLGEDDLDEEEDEVVAISTKWLTESFYERTETTKPSHEPCHLAKCADFDKILKIVVGLACSDVLEDTLNLRLVCKSFKSAIDDLDFVSFSCDGKRSLCDAGLHQTTGDNEHGRLKLLRILLEQQMVDTQPKFLSNKKQFIYTIDLNDRVNQFKIENPFTTTNGNYNTFQISILIQIPSDTIPIHFNVLGLCNQTSTFEEYLFRYHLTMTDLHNETKIYPFHRKHYFQPKTNTVPLFQAETCKYRHGGFYLIRFSLTTEEQTIDISIRDIQRQTTIKEMAQPLLLSVPKDTPIMPQHLLVSSSAAGRNICRQVSFMIGNNATI